MSDTQKATLALTLLVESCTAALNSLTSREGPDDHPSVDFPTLRTDFISILSIIHAATTKIALSLKPSSPTHKASLVPLKDITNNVAALVHSIRLMRFREGVTIMKEYENLARNVITAVQSLAQTLLVDGAGGSGEDYLVQTGEVHETIDRARKPGGLSLDNRDAVRRSWTSDHGSLVDAYEELQDICKAADSSAEGDDDEDQLGDGWDELGFSSDKKLSASELDRAQKVQSLVKLVLLLHKRIIKDFFSSTERKVDNATLDRFAELSAGLSELFDDFVSSMYAPHNGADITQYLDALLVALKELKTILLPIETRERSLEERLESVSISQPSQTEKSDKWFITCYEQLDKLASKVSDTLQETKKPHP
ncbi:hypothetical protein D9613_003055 [Agrocybe pediades]|uniref:Grap2 and cyclin-D-interacting-domain-containing protein n=1 Tax=Agrocybe pediades TaxID=84607 RepID=A0A8H4VM12_9AGAR|nr:hypothetical protein D9613_003055 [Agrocybe pediades]